MGLLELSSQVAKLTIKVNSLCGQLCCKVKECLSIDADAGDSSLFLNQQGDWVEAGGDEGWSLTGNTGTTAGTNFIGTTDTQDLVFKTNSILSGRIGRGVPGNSNTSLGYESLLNNIGIANTTFGSKAGKFITSGGSNTVVGQNSGLTLTTGGSNTLIGDTANVATNSTTEAIALGKGATAESNQFAIPDAVTRVKFAGLQQFADNAAALAGGLGVGELYYTSSGGDGLVKIVI